MPDRVIIFDTTLRDGEQSPGIALDSDDKVAIANQLAALGVDVIEAGFPIASDGDFAAVQRIAREVDGPIIAGLARCGIAEDIDRAWEAVKDSARPRIHVFLATSAIHMEHKLRMTEDEVLEAVRAGVSQARALCDDVEFSPEDGSRSDIDFMVRVCQAAVAAGATTINIPDTVGYGTPTDYGARIKRVVEDVKGDRDDVVISTHCHNDLGLAVANALAAVENGARQVEVAVNGIGERAGNTALEEVVMAINTRSDHYQVETGIDTTQLFPASRLVSRLTGYPVQYNKAVVGRNAFAHESGIHQHGVLRERTTYEIMDPTAVGQDKSKLVLGKHSGRAAFGDALKELGINLEDEDFEAAFARFKELADRKGEIVEEGLLAIVHDQVDLSDAVHFLGWHATGRDNQAEATITVEREGVKESFTSSGDGMVHSIFAALGTAFGIEARLLDYRVEPVSLGADAMAEVRVLVQVRERTFTGTGSSTDIVEASARSFTSALNKAARASAY
ncbi:MAG: 2-isopropylmalate synthase [Acidimicrobiia bacterium]|nr:2-isopropylmalate synthase [Acidimicrobiia bacterium]